MKKLLATLLVLFVQHAWAAPPCPVTAGTLSLHVTQPRASAISPALLFFDATTSTDTKTLGGANNAFQDVYYTWDFGDSGASGGTNKWTTGANGQPFMNKGTGPVAAHLYVLPINATADVTNTVQVWAYDGTNIATCTVTVTVFAPSGTNGFPGVATYCVFNTTLGTGCPTGAASVTATTASAALTNLTNGRRALLKCGDTFTGTLLIPSNLTTASIGAYGSCVGTVSGTASGRPVISVPSGDGMIFNAGGVGGNQVDVRITDLEVSGNTSSNLFSTFSAAKIKQVTMVNVWGHHFQNGLLWATTPQSGIISSAVTDIVGISSTFGAQGLFFNNFGSNLSSAAPCFTNGSFCDIRYGALINDLVDMAGTLNSAPAGSETLRIEACIFCVVTNNTFQNANNSGATIKHVCGQGSGGAFNGQTCGFNVFTDNFLNGKSGEFLFEDSTTNSTLDERKQFILIERNFIVSNDTLAGENNTHMVLLSSPNSTYRNNVNYNIAGLGAGFGNFTVQVARRGVEGTGPPTGMEIYNNTCYTLTTLANCVVLEGGLGCCTAAPNNSFAQNNLFYNNGASGTTVVDAGTGNTVNSNTTNPSLNPSMKNPSGNFSQFIDFVPTANATGATSAVPNYFDGFGLSWGTKMRLGALSPAAP